MTVAEADDLVALSSTATEPKQTLREAWENHEPSPTYSVPDSPVVHLVFPAEQHVRRYAEQAKRMGY